jgi:peptide/nickel transport system ATP-binding protein
MEQQILTGEIPDPTRIPEGCRFHPRCPLLKSSTLPETIAFRCINNDPGPVPVDAEAAAACWPAMATLT